MEPLISSENTLGLWTVIIAFVCFAMFAERRFRWAKAVGTALICLIGGMILPTINLVPTAAPVYDAVWDYVVPVAIPLVLFDADIRRIGKESGKLVFMFFAACCGTMLGAFVAAAIFNGHIPEMHKAAAMFIGSQTGGSMNLVVMSEVFEISENMFSAVYIADTLTFSVTLFTLTMLPKVPFLRKFNGTKYQLDGTPLDASYLETTKTPGQSDDMNTFDMVKGLALSFLIVLVSTTFANFVKEHTDITIIQQLFGQKYLVITLVTVILATVFPKQVGGIRGTQKLGIFLMYIFMVVVSTGADLKDIVTVGPALIGFSFVVFAGIVVVSIIFGKIFHYSIEEICVPANSALGGPPTAAAFAAANGWTELVTPAILLGTLGYIVGNYFGVFMGNIILKVFGV